MPAYYTYKCTSCGFTQERYRNVKKCPKCDGNFERIVPFLEVNIGDGDKLKIRAMNLTELERKINKGGEFESSMINYVTKLWER